MVHGMLKSFTSKSTSDTCQSVYNFFTSLKTTLRALHNDVMRIFFILGPFLTSVLDSFNKSNVNLNSFNIGMTKGLFIDGSRSIPLLI